MPPHRPLLAAATGLTLLAGTAFAQSPSADQIINSLRPGAGMTSGTRGIRPVGPSEAPAAATPPAGQRTPAVTPRASGPAATAGPAAAPSAPSVNLTVQFATNSAELTPAAMRTLDELGRALTSQSLSGFRFRIEGHTDTVGLRDRNVALSEARANKVVEYLTNKFGVDRGKVQAVGMGPDQPLVATGANVPEPRNRRVTVINLGA